MKKLHVLLVEDEPSDADLIREYLYECNSIDFNISHARTLGEATQLLKSDLFNIILLDLGLPDSSGLNSLKELYGTFSRVPILVITGLENEEIGRESITMGAHGYITKSRMDNYNLTNSIMHAIERHQHILKIRISEKELEQKNKLLSETLASKNRMFSIIGHDLKSPFSSMLGLLNLVYFEYDRRSEREKKAYIKACLKTAQNTYELIENLLEWSRTQTGNLKMKPKNTNFYKVVQNTLAHVDQQLKDKDIDVQVKVPEETILYIDENALEVVLRNVISNAIKFTDKGGKITLDILDQKNDMTTIMIEDNGTGIAEEQLNKLFKIGDSFTSPGTENEKGTGLGLMLCKEFINKHQGNIWVESELNKGTRVYFTLSTASPSEETEKEDKIPEELKKRSGRQKILIVDDDEAVLSYLSGILDPEKTHLITASNGAEAVRSVLEHKDISVILMDLLMPAMNGLEAMHEIRRINPDIPILAQTAFSSSQLKTDEEDSDWFDGVILKPYQKNEIIDIIEKHCKKNSMHNSKTRATVTPGNK